MLSMIPSPAGAVTSLFRTFVAATVKVMEEVIRDVVQQESKQVSSALADQLKTKYQSLVALDENSSDDEQQQAYLSRLLTISDLQKNIQIMNGKVESLKTVVAAAAPQKGGEGPGGKGPGGGGGDPAWLSTVDKDMEKLLANYQQTQSSDANRLGKSMASYSSANLLSATPATSLSLSEMYGFYEYIKTQGEQILVKMLRNVLGDKVRSLITTHVTPLYKTAIDNAVRRVMIDYSLVQKMTTQLDRSSQKNWKELDDAMQAVSNAKDKSAAANAYLEKWETAKKELEESLQANLKDRIANETQSLRTSPALSTPTPPASVPFLPPPPPPPSTPIPSPAASKSLQPQPQPVTTRGGMSSTRGFGGRSQTMKPYFIFRTDRPGKIKSRRLYR